MLGSAYLEWERHRDLSASAGLGRSQPPREMTISSTARCVRRRSCHPVVVFMCFSWTGRCFDMYDERAESIFDCMGGIGSSAPYGALVIRRAREGR
jgi:hypothetical protein